MVSFNDSPFFTLDEPASVNPIYLPSKRLIALSKLKRVRVEGSKNNVAITLPCKRFWLGFFSNSSAKSRILKTSSFEKSVIDTKFLFFIKFGYLVVLNLIYLVSINFIFKFSTGLNLLNTVSASAFLKARVIEHDNSKHWSICSIFCSFIIRMISFICG